MERGPIEVIVLEERRGEERIEVVKVNDVERVVKRSHGSVSALMKGVPGVTRSSSVIWVSNWTQEEWWCAGLLLAYVRAEGDFYVSVGSVILAVRNKSGDYIAASSLQCYFNTWVEGVGTPYAQVTANGKYITWAPPCGACPFQQGNAVLIARAGLDVNLNYYNDGFGQCITAPLHRLLSYCSLGLLG